MTPNVVDYTDYRAFLRDYYSHAKKRNPRFSLQVFCTKAGMSSKGLLHNVMQGKRRLSRSNILGLSEAMKLTRKQSDYFENLVAFNHGHSLKERNHYFAKLLAIKADGSPGWEPQLVRRDQFEFYSKWYHSAVRSVIDLQGFAGDYQRLAKSVRPEITVRQARKSVDLLLRMGLIEQDAENCYVVTGKSIATTREVAGLALMNFHRQMGALGLDALETVPYSERDYAGITLGISERTYEQIRDDIYALRRKIARRAAQDPHADRVYQLNFQFFPLSHWENERKTE